MVLVSVAMKLGCKFNAAVLLILCHLDVSHAIFALLRTESVSLPVLTLISTHECTTLMGAVRPLACSPSESLPKPGFPSQNPSLVICL